MTKLDEAFELIGNRIAQYITGSYEQGFNGRMGNSYQERLSAYVDDELCEFELRRVTDELLKSEAARNKLKHYQLIGAAIRDEPDIVFDQSLSDRVMAEIEALPEDEQWDLGGAEAAPAAGTRRGRPWLKVVVGAAIAASVALVSLTVLKSITSHTVEPVATPPMAKTAPEQPVQENGIAASSAVASAPPSELAQPVSSPSLAPPPVVPIPPAMSGSANARLLEGYLATHAEHASRRTMLPRARIMGFDIPVEDER